jgi:hypothetical protein
MEKTLIAKITEKIDGKPVGRVWHVYRLADGRIAYVEDGSNKVTFAEEVQSSSKKAEKYTVYYAVDTAKDGNTTVIGCTCKSRKYRKGKACKHMLAMIDVFNPKPAPAPVSSPVVEKPAKPAKKTEIVRGTLNGNKGFSLMKRAS